MIILSMVVRSDHCETCVNTELEFLETAVYAKLAENHSCSGDQNNWKESTSEPGKSLGSAGQGVAELLAARLRCCWRCALLKAMALLAVCASGRAEGHQAPFPAHPWPACPHPSQGQLSEAV